MKTILWLLAGAVALVAIFYVFNNYMYQEKQGEITNEPVATTTTMSAEIVPIEHATTVIKWGETTVYTDPVGGAEKFAGQRPADIILVTDIHSDHFSTSTLSAVVGSSTMLIAPKAVADQLPQALKKNLVILNNGERTTAQSIEIEAVPMYNLPTADNADLHTKGRGNGYVLEKDGFRVYIAGDTAGTPEMRSMSDIDIALVPMNLPFTMGVEEAAAAVLDFKPKVVYPYHYRGQDGLADVTRFKQLVDAGNAGITVVLADWYPNQ